MFKTDDFSVVINDPSVVELFSKGSLSELAEAYVKGRWDVTGDPEKAIAAAEELACDRAQDEHVSELSEPTQQAAASHYDLPVSFWKLWLDPSLTYTCAYWSGSLDQESLHIAQLTKHHRICRKLDLKKGDRLLDIGCGWGALSCFAQNEGARVTGINVSTTQLTYAKTLSSTACFAHLDWRNATGVYDKIAAVGVIEHVPANDRQMFFDKLMNCLRPGGLALVHGITQKNNRDYGGVRQFVDKYVFPGAELMQVSDWISSAESSGFEIVDVESMRRHYAITLREWRYRLEQNASQAKAIVGEEKYRVFLLYLAGFAHQFEKGRFNLHQVLLRAPGGDETPSLQRPELPII